MDWGLKSAKQNTNTPLAKDVKQYAKDTFNPFSNWKTQDQTLERIKSHVMEAGNDKKVEQIFTDNKLSVERKRVMIAQVIDESQKSKTETVGGILSSIFQQARNDREDVIFFRNNDVLRGKIINDKIGILALYGEITVSTAKCAGISFEGSRANTEGVVTVNFNGITGVIKEQNIQFKIGSSGT